MKKLFGLLVCMVMVVGLAACGSKEEAVSGDTEVSTSVSQDEPEAEVLEEETDGIDPSLKAQLDDLESKYMGLTTDTLTWELDEGTGTLTISGEGPMRDYYENTPEWADYVYDIKHVVIGDGVTSIGAGAFFGFYNISDVTLGADIEFIGEYAFYQCYKLTGINFSTGLKYIGANACEGVGISGEFVLPEGLIYLGESSFSAGLWNTSVYIPASLEYIDKDALAFSRHQEYIVSDESKSFAAQDGVLYNKDITELVNYPGGKEGDSFEIPGTVEKIRSAGVAYNEILVTVTVPASVKEIEETGICRLSALKYIYVDENNKDFISDDGILYSAGYKKLLCYPKWLELTEYTVKDGAEKIGDYAIRQVVNLEVLIIPEGVKRIGENALEYCGNLTELTLPESLESIEAYATNGCNKLKCIYYGGSAENWGNVEKSFDGNEPLVMANSPVEIVMGK